MVIVIPGAYYIWKLGRDPLIYIFFFNVKKNVFQKLAGLWLVGEVVNHVGLYGSKVAEGYSAFQRRSCSYPGEEVFVMNIVMRVIIVCYLLFNAP